MLLKIKYSGNSLNKNKVIRVEIIGVNLFFVIFFHACVSNNNLQSSVYLDAGPCSVPLRLRLLLIC